MKDSVQNFVNKSKLENSRYVIAIDGLSSCGKSTLAKDMAQILGYAYVDSGAMYRAVALFFLENEVEITLGIDYGQLLSREVKIHFQNIEGLNTTFLNGINVEREIRQPRISSIVSDVASNSSVRRFLVNQQRILGQKDGIIMDGRDIGTVVFPNADFKLFVTADIEERARRRHLELNSRGLDVSFEDVKQNLASRDHKDSTRDDSPLVQSEDAVVLDTTNHDRESQLKQALEYLLSATQPQ